MRKLNDQNFLNAPEEYERIFASRSPDAIDIMRWERLISRYKGGRLVDLGCLDSLIPFWAKQRFPEAEVWGLDCAREVIKKLSEQFPQINYRVGDATETEFPDSYFDYVVAGELIEHLDHPTFLFSEVSRILKPGGIFALTTPKEEEPGGVDAGRHLWSFSKRDIKDMAANYFSVVKVGEIPSWLRRRIKYTHPYIIAFLTK